MSLKDEIEAYVPVNRQEENDRIIMLDMIGEKGIFTRENKTAHFTASCWIVNETFDKVLMCYHNIYDSYSWLGGHCDGEKDLLKVALREAQEESGIKVRAYDGKIVSLEVLPVNGHEKKGEYVSSHLHLNVTYLLIGNDGDPLVVSPSENSDLKWFDLDKVLSCGSEQWFNTRIYPKLIDRVKSIKRL